VPCLIVAAAAAAQEAPPPPVEPELAPGSRLIEARADIGLSTMLAVGPAGFREMLAGFHEMDEHFRTTPFEGNRPSNTLLVDRLTPDSRSGATPADGLKIEVLAYAPSVRRLW
jgi:hypothetical protein